MMTTITTLTRTMMTMMMIMTMTKTMVLISLSRLRVSTESFCSPKMSKVFGFVAYVSILVSGTVCTDVEQETMVGTAISNASAQ